jgi:hypothetical protein
MLEERPMATKFPVNSVSVPEMLVRQIAPDLIAVRFWKVGGRQQFMTLLEHFRTEFFLARPPKIRGLDWLFLLASQRAALEEFSRRYGLRVVEEFHQSDE